MQWKDVGMLMMMMVAVDSLSHIDLKASSFVFFYYCCCRWVTGSCLPISLFSKNEKQNICKFERVKLYFHNFALLHHIYVAIFNRTTKHLSMSMQAISITQYVLSTNNYITFYSFIIVNGLIVQIQCVHESPIPCKIHKKNKQNVYYTHKWISSIQTKLCKETIKRELCIGFALWMCIEKVDDVRLFNE